MLYKSVTLKRYNPKYIFLFRFVWALVLKSIKKNQDLVV